jgi:hypothetical protein
LKGAQPGQESAGAFDGYTREMKDSMMHTQMTNTLPPAPGNSTSRLDADLGASSHGIVAPLHRARGEYFPEVSIAASGILTSHLKLPIKLTA